MEFPSTIYYKKYLEDSKKKGSGTSTSGIYVIEINLAVASIESWVFDTRSMIHTCKSLQGLKRTRKFLRGKLDVLVANRWLPALIICHYP
jgi:hypothetical protein